MRRRASADDAARRVGLFLLTITALAISLHAFGADAEKGTFARRWLNLGRDNSLQEFYGYALAVICAVGFAVSWRRTGVRAYLAGAVALVFVVADDALGYHEAVGRLMNRNLPMPSFGQVYGSQVGELVAWAAAGVPIALLLLVAARQHLGVTVRVGVVLAGVIGSIAVFAVGADLVHTYTREDALTWIEDGGELVALSLSAWAVIALARDPWPLPAVAPRSGARRHPNRDAAPSRRIDAHGP